MLESLLDEQFPEGLAICPRVVRTFNVSPERRYVDVDGHYRDRWWEVLELRADPGRVGGRVASIRGAG